MPLANPFKPTAGAEPPVLIGRDDVLEDFSEGLDDGVGAPGRLMRITGPRGSGKTVLLTELGDVARERGWLVIDETASNGLAETIRRKLMENTQIKEVTIGAKVAVVEANVKVSSEHGAKTLRDAMDAVAARLTDKGVGLLITIDEVQDADEADLRELAAAVQHLIRERKNVAFVFAGITTGVMDLLNGKALTFLRRAKAEELGPIPIAEVRTAFKETIEKTGLSIDDDALELAASSTEGYAYLVQLIGYYVWRTGYRRGGASATIGNEDAVCGIQVAKRDFGSMVLETALSDLPRTAMDYLLAMTDDPAASSTGTVASRLGMPATSLSSVRQLLISRQVIEPTARGYVSFSIPFMREYLVKNRSSLLARYGVVE